MTQGKSFFKLKVKGFFFTRANIFFCNEIGTYCLRFKVHIYVVKGGNLCTSNPHHKIFCLRQSKIDLHPIQTDEECKDI